MPGTPLLDEFVVGAGGDPFAFNYIEGLAAALSQNYEQPREDPSLAFAPPEPLLLPEVVVRPPAPAPTPLLPAWLLEAVPRLLPVVGLIVPMTSGPPGTGDLPDDFSIRDNQFRPPPPAAPPPTAFDDEQPPNWQDILDEPYRPFPERRFSPDIANWIRIASRVWDLMRPGPAAPDAFPVPLLDEFIVAPPAVVRTAPLPSYIEVPFGPADFGLNFGARTDVGTGAEPRPAPAPRGTPRGDPLPANPFELVPETERRPVSLPSGDVAPYLFGDPSPNDIRDPIGDPLPAPPRPAPTGGSTPIPGFILPIVPTATPADADVLTQFRPESVRPKKDTCSCAKKKPKKKREPRSVCYRGTYVETKKGISKQRIEEVPCTDSSPRRREKIPSSSTPSTRKRKPKLKPGQFPTLNIF